MMNNNVERVVSGLRPKGNKGKNKTIESLNDENNLPLCSSPLDRLCTLILKWDFLNDAEQAVNCKMKDLPIKKFSDIPIVFPSYSEYIAIWEPLVLEEIKANFLSNFNSKIRQNVTSKTFQFSTMENANTKSNMISLETQFSTALNDYSDRSEIGVMDLVLISLDPITPAVFNYQPAADKSKDKTVDNAKGLKSKTKSVTENNGKSGAKSQTAINNSSVADSNTTVDSSSTSATQQRDKKSVTDRLMLGMVVSSTFVSGAKLFQVKVLRSEWEAVKGGIKAHSAVMGNVTSTGERLVNKNGRLSSYKMHVVAVDNLRSSWREFLAIHELGCNIPLLSEILGSARSMDMSHTPPIHSEEATFHNNASPEVPAARKTIADPRLAARNKNAAEKAANANKATAVQNSDGASVASLGSSSLSQKARVPIEQEVAEWRMHGVTDKFMRYLRGKFNPSQLHAIRTAATQMGFTLVQGPPGTGKTSTIIGMLNSIHIREYNRYYELALSTVLGPIGQSCRESNSETAWLNLISKLSKAKPHILVVAPSNVAVDNIIERIMEDGFYDGNGGKYNPSMLRVGGGKTPRVQSVSLEDTMRVEEVMMRTNHTERLGFVEGLSQQINEHIRDVYFHQSILFNLKTAFDAHYPLPEGFELRVSTKTGHPYWVDHIQRKTSYTPPVIVKHEVKKEVGSVSSSSQSHVKIRYRKIEHLPEYLQHSHRLTQLLDQLDICNLKRTRLQAIIASSHGRFSGTASSNSSSAQSPAALGKEMLESSVIDGAQLLFTTLNSSGHPSMEATEFCVTLIDEAAQCVEPSVLIALRRGCKQCIMVGDQKQLSATTFSNSAKAVGYDKSLFERLVETGHPYIMLDTQYRMAPDISNFPSDEFYNSQLRNGTNVSAPGYLPVYIKSNNSSDDDQQTVNAAGDGVVSAVQQSKSSRFDILTASYRVNSTATDRLAAPLFKSFMFFDLLSSQEEESGGQSKSNLEEVALCVRLLRALIAEASRLGSTLGSVGVITPYGEQLGELKRALIREKLMQPKDTAAGSSNKKDSGSSNASATNVDSSSNSNTVANVNSSGGTGVTTDSTAELDVECNTVDGFQGREKDIIIISTVRANNNDSIGFLSDTRRMNVALTRAKFGMFVVGHADTLSRNEHWGDMLQYAHSCQGYVEVPDSATDLVALLANCQKREKLDRQQSVFYDTTQSISGGDANSYYTDSQQPMQNDDLHQSQYSTNYPGVNAFSSSHLTTASAAAVDNYNSVAAPPVKRRRLQKGSSNSIVSKVVVESVAKEVEDGEIHE